MYARRVGDEVLDFGHRGWLYEESFLLYDLKTDSLWVQATGESVHGPLKGTRLNRLPAIQTTWSAWRRLHPETKVLGRQASETTQYHQDSYATYYATGRGIRYQYHAALNFGLAVLVDSQAKLYPLNELAKQPVLIDQVGSTAVVIVYHPATHTAVAWDPRWDGQPLIFSKWTPTETDIILTETKTGSEWSGLTGQCLNGRAKGAQLEQRLSTQFVIENWRLHYPDAPVYHAQ